MNGQPIVSATRIRAAGLVVSLGIAFSAVGTDASAQSRWVFVNGERLNDAQVANLARMNCSDIPDGSYWLNTQTGAWGYAGNRQVQGLLGDSCSGNGGNGNSAAGRHGPYATLRRAEAVANEYRAQGYRAVAFHSGDGYVVDVRR